VLTEDKSSTSSSGCESLVIRALLTNVSDCVRLGWLLLLLVEVLLFACLFTVDVVILLVGSNKSAMSQMIKRKGRETMYY